MDTSFDYNVDMLVWAIKRAGTDLDNLSKSFPKLKEWLNKERKPTVKQLQAVSKKLHVPFGYLFLDKPPDETIPFPFFRSQSRKKQEISLNLYDSILVIQKRQAWLSEYLQEIGFSKLELVGMFTERSKPDEIVKEIRRQLGLEEEWACKFITPDQCVNHLSERIEELGIVVIFNGVVENSNNRAISVDECRGFVLVDNYAPFMFVNNGDGKAAQLFTLLHELAHVFIGKSAGFDYQKLLPAQDPVEQMCDYIAAEFLVPRTVFQTQWELYPSIEKLAKHFHVSRIVIARRALDLGKISKEDFFGFYNLYRFQLQTKKDKQSNGGDFYATQKKRVSPRFAAFVDQAVKADLLLYRDAYKLTGLKGETYERFISKILKS